MSHLQSVGARTFAESERRSAAIPILTTVAVVIAAIVVCSTLYGVYRFYSPIPYWDQWDGYVGFYQMLREGQVLKALWSQHMEHRIVISHLLFWADIAWFGGMNVFTIICNLALSLGVALVLIYETRHAWSKGAPIVFAGAFAMSLAFCWSQKVNLTWGFQSQCILVYLFALLAFARLSRDDPKGINLTAAIIFGALATISMGNGIAVFVVGAIQCFLLRRSWERILALLVAGAIIGAAYFHDYTKPILDITGPAPRNILLTKIAYFFALMGSPIYYSLLNSSHGLNVAILFGLAIFIFVAVVLFRLYRSGSITPYRGFLVATYGFVVVSAIGASNSRWMQGLETAITSRYTTPAVVGMIATGLLLLDITHKKGRTFAMLGLVIVAGFLALSSKSVNDDNSILFSWKLGVLGQKIGVDHLEYEGLVYPLSLGTTFKSHATTANEYQIGPYGSGWLHDAGIVKYDPVKTDPTLCAGNLEEVKHDKVGQTASGWVVAKNYAQASTLILLVDGTGKTAGYGVTGQSRPDVQKVVAGAPPDAGWIGFADGGAQNVRPYAYIGGKFCPFGTSSN
ncbi:hypothetical protein [Paraburkholderia sp. A1RO-1]|uniref:hypothetical protein n=1 Tax=Paraburkholderia sp. A1RO-1 TaxID=3028368 RepID=UPI003B7F98EA